MSQFTIKAKFNKQTKDSKKELVQFFVTGDDERNPEISRLTRTVVLLEIEGVEGIALQAEFAKSSKDSKKTILDFIIKGDKSADQTFEFYKKAGRDVNLTIKEGQMSLEDFRKEEPREGIEYQTDGSGVVSRPDNDPNQTTIDEIKAAQNEAAPSSEPNEDEEDGEEL